MSTVRLDLTCARSCAPQVAKGGQSRYRFYKQGVHVKFIPAFAAAIVLLAGCGPSPSSSNSKPSAIIAAAKPAEKPDQTPLTEKIGENTYRIDLLGITVDAPAGWYVVDSELMSKLMDEGAKVSGANLDAGTKAAVDGSMARTATLFTFLEVPPGTPREYIPAIFGIAEDVSIMPGVTSGRDYFFHAKKIMAQSTIQMITSDVIGGRMIGGHSFDRMDVQVSAPGGMTVNQRFYATRRDDHVISIIQSYVTDEELAQLDAVLDSIKLDW